MRLLFCFVAGALLAPACADSDVDRTLGARCEQTNDCDERCLLPGRNTPGGFCTLSCRNNDDCPGDSVCADRDGGICLVQCKLDANCNFLGTGWYCEELDGKDAIKVMACYGA